MNQPELGRHLASLRSEKGFTQQEIADKSGINIRTIQRIESGEVSPRTFTVRQYLNAMNLEYQEVMNEYKSEGHSVYKIAWMLGIVCFIIGFPESYFGKLLFERSLTSTESTFFILAKVISVSSYFYFIKGFLHLGKTNQIPLMAVSSMFLMIGAIASGVFEILGAFQMISFRSVIASESVYFGAIGVLFGISLFKAEQITGKYGVVAGLLEVLAGFTFLSVFLGFVGLFIHVPAELLEIIILYSLAQKVGKLEFTH